MSVAKELAARLRRLAADPVLVADEARNSFEVYASLLERQAERIEALEAAMAKADALFMSLGQIGNDVNKVLDVMCDGRETLMVRLLAHAPGDKP